MTTKQAPTQMDMFNHHMAMNNQALAAIAKYLSEQTKEATKVPGITRLTTYNLLNPVLPSPTALQIIPKNDRRESVAVTNVGPADCIISERYFDPTSILQLFSDPNFPDAIAPGYNQAIPIGYLIAGANGSFSGVMGLWAYSLGSAAASNQNAILSIADSVYVGADDAAPPSQIAAMHLNGLHPSEEPGGGAVN